MAKNSTDEKKLDQHKLEPTHAEDEGFTDGEDAEGVTAIDGEAIAAATAQMFKGLMSQIQYAAMAVANGEEAKNYGPEGSPTKPKEVIDARNLAREIPLWIQRAYESEWAAEELATNADLLEWLNRKSCKRKEYYDDFKALQQITDFYAELGRFDLGIKAAEKALAITNLHHQGDSDIMSDLHWSLAQLNAANQDMERAERWLTKCILSVDPGATSQSETYRGLLAQLKETFINARQARMAS